MVKRYQFYKLNQKTKYKNRNKPDLRRINPNYVNQKCILFMNPSCATYNPNCGKTCSKTKSTIRNCRNSTTLGAYLNNEIRFCKTLWFRPSLCRSIQTPANLSFLELNVKINRTTPFVGTRKSEIIFGIPTLNTRF